MPTTRLISSPAASHMTHVLMAAVALVRRTVCHHVAHPTRARLAVAALTAVVALASDRSAAPLHAQTRTTGATVSGRVRETATRPARDAFVTLLRETTDEGARRLTPVDTAQAVTAADGRYSFSRVAAGTYYVVAIPANTQFTNDGQPNRTGYGISYFPNATTLAAARKIRLTGRVVVTANVTLVPAALSIISGRVVDAGDRPVGNAPLQITYGGGLPGARALRATAAADGRFRLAGFPPATYLLRTRGDAPPSDEDASPTISTAKVIVDGHDVAGVVVRPVDMVVVSGRATVSDEMLRAALIQSPVSLGVALMDADEELGPKRPGVIEEDLTFELRTWPGRGVITISSPAWIVKAVRLNGMDVTKGIDFTPGSRIEGLDVELEPR